MEESAIETMELLEKAATNYGDFNIHPYFHEYTMSIISKIALGERNIKQFENEYTQILISVLQAFENNIFSIFAWIFPALWHVLLKIQMATELLKNSGLIKLVRNVSKTVEERKKMRASYLKFKSF